MRNSVLSILCVAVVVVLGSVLLSTFLQNNNYFDKITVGIVIADDSDDSKTLFRLLYAMESVNSICKFTYMEEEEAQEELANGNIHAVVMLNPDFYEDVYTGVNTPVQLLLGREKGFETSIFYELVLDGCELVRITEGAIYATMDVMDVYETKISVSDMQDMFTKLYIENILRRYDTFEEILLSPTGELNYTQYYFVSVVCIVVLLFGLNFAVLYKDGEMAIARLLRREGLSNISVSMVKTIVMSVQIWLVMTAWYGGGCIFCYFAESAFLSWSVWGWLLLIPVAVSMAAYFNMIYSWCQNRSKSGMILFVMNTLMLLVSGVLVPVSYMPEWVEAIYNVMPLTAWWQYISSVLFEEVSLAGFGTMTAVAFCFEVLGVLGICKRC